VVEPQPLGLLGGHRLPGLAQQCIHKQPAAHADTPVDAPDRQLEAGPLERFAPGQDVLVNAVDERPVEVE
jgi:hypothetical protein